MRGLNGVLRCVVREVVTGRDRDTCKFRVEVMHALLQPGSYRYLQEKL